MGVWVCLFVGLNRLRCTLSYGRSHRRRRRCGISLLSAVSAGHVVLVSLTSSEVKKLRLLSANYCDVNLTETKFIKFFDIFC